MVDFVVTHARELPDADNGNPNMAQSDDWNAAHKLEIDNSANAGYLVGRLSNGDGNAELLTLAAVLSWLNLQIASIGGLPTALSALASAIPAFAVLPITGNAVGGNGDVGALVTADATAGALSYTLPSAPSNPRPILIIKTDSSANRVTVKNGAVDAAWLSAQGDVVTFAYDGSSWRATAWNIAPLKAVFTSSSTWTKPPLASAVNVTAIGAGSGGGSGRRGAAASNRYGGNPGNPGQVIIARFRAAMLSATEAITIAAGSTGGTAQTADSTNGRTANAPGNTSFGSKLVLTGVAGGAGGSNVTVASQPNAGLYELGSVPAAAGSGVLTGAVAGSDGLAGQGGYGGAIDASNTRRSGGNAGAGSFSRAPITGGLGGTAAGAAGNPGTDVSDTDLQLAASGGGAGASGDTAGTVAGGAGANGGNPGGSGGGGGASTNGANSGPGGDGGRGEIRVVTEF